MFIVVLARCVSQLGLRTKKHSLGAYVSTFAPFVKQRNVYTKKNQYRSCRDIVTTSEGDRVLAYIHEWDDTYYTKVCKKKGERKKSPSFLPKRPKNI